MSAGKIVLLVVYAVLAGLALTQGDTTTGAWALRALGILAVVHLIETAGLFQAVQGGRRFASRTFGERILVRCSACERA